ncbi:hypothetical protein ACO0LF_22120 [Undibacterium sp. Di27W]|uniref:hypothetical protein n=1 Tax=Undibacterium sp. Di27W TaxID=3413036 RepID=UPI003BF109F1
MRLITNEEVMVVAGGDLEPDEPVQTVEIVGQRMTDDEKHDYDKGEIWAANGSGGGV